MRMPGALCLTLLLVQSLPVPGEASDAAQLERIRRQLADPPAIVVSSTPGRDGPVFRVTVQERRPDTPAWADLSGVPPYVRPMAPTYHYEFLKQVTPEEFRQGTLYPVGIPVVPLVQLLAKGIRTAQRKAAEVHAREEVRQALEELLACRANPDRPGC
jgi:hypothetical protein